MPGERAIAAPSTEGSHGRHRRRRPLPDGCAASWAGQRSPSFQLLSWIRKLLSLDQYMMSTWLFSCVRCSARSFLQGTRGGAAGRRAAVGGGTGSSMHGGRCCHLAAQRAAWAAQQVQSGRGPNSATWSQHGTHRARASAGLSANCFFTQVAICTAGGWMGGGRGQQQG